MLRIIAGEYKGRRIKTLQGARLRPTSDPLRETLFNILAPRMVGATFVDAYAGSGAVGIEALSRGAQQVTFIEHQREAVDCIRANLLALEITSGFSIIHRDVIRALEEVEGFDICFLDPPYAETQEYENVLSALGNRINFTDAALVIAEHSKHLRLEDSYGRLERTQLREQGDSRLSFYRIVSALR